MRTAEVPEDASRRRLARLTGGGGGGWTPTQLEADAVPAPGWRHRVTATPRGAAVAWLAAAGVVVLLLAGHVWHRGGGAGAAVGQPAPRAVVPAAAPTVATIVVDVGGRVRHPGLVRLPAGSRVADAIAAAGGALRTSDLTTMNLAARVADGQLLLVGVPGAAGADAGGGGTAPVDINTATVEELDALPGVGPVLAQRIVDWRTAHGGFRSVDDLRQVPGIGARKYDDLKALVVA